MKLGKKIIISILLSLLLIIGESKVKGFDVIHKVEGPTNAKAYFEKLTTTYNKDKNQKFKYEEAGSNEAINSLESGAAVIGVTNYPYSANHTEILKDIDQIPLAAYAGVMIYKMTGFALELRGVELKKIMNGTYSRWAEINPTYPNVEIIVYLGKKDQGIEYTLYNYLNQVDEVPMKGNAYQPIWGATIRRVEDNQIEEMVEQSDPSLGLSTLSKSATTNLVKLENLETNAILLPNMEGIQKAQETNTQFNEKRGISLINAKHQSAYPMVNYVYLQIKLKSLRCDDAEEVYSFMQTILNSDDSLEDFNMQRLAKSERTSIWNQLQETWECYGGEKIQDRLESTQRSLIIFLIVFFSIVFLIFACIVCVSFLSCFFFIRQYIFSRRLKIANKRDDGPEGKVTMVFTDIEGFTSLFERFPELGHKAMELHDQLIREQCKVFHGYEVKTEGDSFMLAFDDVLNAMLFCNAVQENLMSAAWPPQLLVMPQMKTIFSSDDHIVFNGLRVRMGFSVGKPKRIVSETNKLRSDYIGPSVNLAARISDFGYGGQTLIDQHTYEAIQYKLEDLGDDEKPKVVFDSYAQYQIKGIDKLQNLYTVLPTSLKQRIQQFDPNNNVRGKGYHVPNVLKVDDEICGGGSQEPIEEDEKLEPSVKFHMTPKESKDRITIMPQ